MQSGARDGKRSCTYRHKDSNTGTLAHTQTDTDHNVTTPPAHHNIITHPLAPAAPPARMRVQ